MTKNEADRGGPRAERSSRKSTVIGELELLAERVGPTVRKRQGERQKVALITTRKVGDADAGWREDQVSGGCCNLRHQGAGRRVEASAGRPAAFTTVAGLRLTQRCAGAETIGRIVGETRMRVLPTSLAAALALSATTASAANFNFTFQGNTNFPGTTTGEIFGLTEGFSTPTQVEVFSSTSPAGSYPVFFTPTNSSFSGSFTVASGVITGANFEADKSSGIDVGLNNQFNTNFFGYGASFSATDDVSNNNGFAGATYTPAASSVSAAPEPGTWSLMLGGVGMIGAAMRMARARRREDEVKDIATA